MLLNEFIFQAFGFCFQAFKTFPSRKAKGFLFRREKRRLQPSLNRSQTSPSSKKNEMLKVPIQNGGRRGTRRWLELSFSLRFLHLAQAAIVVQGKNVSTDV